VSSPFSTLGESIGGDQLRQGEILGRQMALNAMGVADALQSAAGAIALFQQKLAALGDNADLRAAPAAPFEFGHRFDRPEVEVAEHHRQLFGRETVPFVPIQSSIPCLLRLRFALR
jgi:hypothetical protein